jgi:hypothetical protein
MLLLATVHVRSKTPLYLTLHFFAILVALALAVVLPQPNIFAQLKPFWPFSLLLIAASRLWVPKLMLLEESHFHSERHVATHRGSSNVVFGHRMQTYRLLLQGRHPLLLLAFAVPFGSCMLAWGYWHSTYPHGCDGAILLAGAFVAFILSFAENVHISALKALRILPRSCANLTCLWILRVMAPCIAFGIATILLAYTGYILPVYAIVASLVVIGITLAATGAFFTHGPSHGIVLSTVSCVATCSAANYKISGDPWYPGGAVVPALFIGVLILYAVAGGRGMHIGLQNAPKFHNLDE